MRGVGRIVGFRRMAMVSNGYDRWRDIEVVEREAEEGIICGNVEKKERYWWW